MSKVTSKLQITLPKALAEQYRIRPGDEVEWLAAGDGVRLVPRSLAPSEITVARRLRLFDKASARQRDRQASVAPVATDRGWTREELYDRGRAD